MNVLLLGVGAHRDYALRSLLDGGHVVGAVDSLHMIPVNWCNWHAAVNPTNLDGICDAVAASGVAWDAVLCWEEVAIHVAHAASRRLGIPGPVMDSLCFRDKGAMHSRLQAHDMPSPQVGVACSLDECEALVRSAGRPAVIKPADFGGSGGVRIVDVGHDVAAAFDAACALSITGRVVVDRYVSGPEYSVETVTWDGGRHQVLGITEKHVSGPPYCVELGHVFPAALPDETAELVRATVTRALDVLRIERGVSHAELKLSSNGPVMMEVAGRPAGDCIPKLVELASGTNLHRMELATVVGAPRPTLPKPDGVAAIRFFTGAPGNTVKVPEVDAILSRPALRTTTRELVYWYIDGSPVPVMNANVQRLGYCIVQGTRSEVSAAFDEAALLEPI